MTTTGLHLRSSAVLDYRFLRAPRILAPADGSKHVPRTGLTIEWAKVANARRIHLELEPDAAPPAGALPAPKFTIDLPGGAPRCRFRMVRSRGVKHVVDVKALAKGGSLTVTDARFTTE